MTDGTTISDYDKEEQKRKFSISTAMVPVVWGDTKVNVLTPPDILTLWEKWKRRWPLRTRR